MIEDERLSQIAHALADPMRLRILRYLMGGAATVSELVTQCETSQSNMSNHLAVLRKCNLVRARRDGRQAAYEIVGVEAAQLVEALSAVAGGEPARELKTPALALARTCYDHAAGKLGVALFDALVSQGALLPTDSMKGGIALGTEAEAVFGALGIDLAAPRREKRQFAAMCLDWTERKPHLSGALGAALLRRLLERGWVMRTQGTRSLIVTDMGAAALESILGIKLRDEADR